MPEILPRFYHSQLRQEDERKLAKIIREGDEIEYEAGRPLRRSADGHRRDRARGIPIVGRVGGGGASPGTDPLKALIAKESRRRRS